MEKKFELLPPMMPNFARFKKEPQLKQDGFKTDPGIDIANFTQQEAEDYAQLMYDTFMKHWQTRKEEKTAS